MLKMKIITHRGLEPSKQMFYPESSYNAFKQHLQRGYGIEFDINFTSDNHIIIFHDDTLERITKGIDKRQIKNLSLNEISQIKLANNNYLCTLNEIFDLIRQYSNSTMSAMHLKGKFQDYRYIKILHNYLKKNRRDVLERLLIFDVKPHIAMTLSKCIKGLHIAPSVSHPYDILRYNSVVCNTLITIEQAIKYKEQKIYDWVWLDEWDLTDKSGGKKSLYNQIVFEQLHHEGYRIALVTPELHATSPDLLGGEYHPDADSKTKLFNRIKQIIKLGPDAICTDYPEEVMELIKNQVKINA